MKLKNQGLAVVEPDDGGGVLVMLPDGTIKPAKSTKSACQIVKRWSRKLTDSEHQSGYVTIEYRGGLEPPKNC